MDESELTLSAPMEKRVIYRYFLLRLRQVEEEGGSVQQFFIKDIQTKEEFYFANLYEIVNFLDDFFFRPGEQEV
jgi:hypothetical protein